MGGLGQQLKGVILYVSLCARQRFLRRAQSDSSRMLKGWKNCWERNTRSILRFFGRQRCKKHGYAKRKRIYRLWLQPKHHLLPWLGRSWKYQRVRKEGNESDNDEWGVGHCRWFNLLFDDKTINFKDSPENKWSIDLCVVTKDSGGNWQRLIHEKRDSPNMIGIFGILPQIQKTIHIKQRKSRNVLDGGTKSETAI